MRVSSMTLKNQNSQQETGSSKPLASLTMAAMSKKHDHVHAGGWDFGFRTMGVSLLLLLFTILWASESAKAQDGVEAPPHPASQHTAISKQTTVVIFADHR